jgi:hypothetical protein
MPTRKQRRRRDKDFRHDVRVYEIDEEGNEVAIAELRERGDEKAPAKAKTQAKKPARGTREVQPPTWERALRRGGLMGGAMLLLFVFVLKSGPVSQRVAIGAFYALAFIPLTYFVDRTAYRSYLKRLDRQSGAKPKPKPAK